MRYLIFLIFPLFLNTSCSNQQLAKGSIDGTRKPPSWIMQGNIYEVNVRQYTPEGSFNAFSTHLQRLKNMGVQTLWFMPIQPISKKDRKGELGSYYAIADYTSVNPEFGTLQDWKNLVDRAHSLGMKVIIDWVANHSGADHRWLTSQPAFYVKDTLGKPVAPFDWTDVRKLDYSNQQLADSMIAAMQYWVRETGIDGFRCDVAAEVPAAFWKRCISELRKTKELFMLAEANDVWLHHVGFDATYPWEEFHTMKSIAAGNRSAKSLDTILNRMDTVFEPHNIRMYFTSNHDENSWNMADWGTMPGEVHAPFAVLTQTLVRSVPLIYSGQEEPHLDSLRFFYKDTIEFGKFQREDFYRTLLNLRKNNPALSADASYRRLTTSNDAAIFAFERVKEGKRVMVVLNLSPASVNFTWLSRLSQNNWQNVFENRKVNAASGFSMAPWEYAVYQ